MRTPPQEYEAWLAGLTPEAIRSMFADHGCTRVLVKRLAPQDNGKNQVYVGPDLTDVSAIPSGEVEASTTQSDKPGAWGQTKFTAAVDWTWLAPRGDSPAPSAKLIFYPQYPEVRLSGLVARSIDPPSSLYSHIDAEEGGQVSGRRLLIGLNPDSPKVWAMILPPDSIAGPGIDELASNDRPGVFRVWELQSFGPTGSTRDALVAKLAEIHALGWVPSQILRPEGPEAYDAQNAHGYTLESLCGVPPNAVAGPDFLGWELKAHRGGKLTLFTPAPDGGWITTVSRLEFMQRYGHFTHGADGRPDRWDFTGVHGRPGWNPRTGLALTVHGWDFADGLAADGLVCLQDRERLPVMSWSFEKLMDRWKSKHSQTAYVPCERRRVNGRTEFRFLGWAHLCMGTRFTRLLMGFHEGSVLFDPGMNIKWEQGARGYRWKPHDRYQFRTNVFQIDPLYDRVDVVDLTV